MMKVQLKGRISKIEETDKQRVAYVSLEAGKTIARIFEALSGGPTIGVIVPMNTCRVGDGVEIDITIRSTS
jgi:hypothetical protein